MRKSFVTPLLLIAGAVTAAGATARPAAAQNLLTNGSFETGSFTDPGNGIDVLPGGSTALTGWTVTGDSVAWSVNGNATGGTADDGAYYLNLAGFNTDTGGQTFGGITQTFATTPGQYYALTVDLGWYRPAGATSDAASYSYHYALGSVSQDGALTVTSSTPVGFGWLTTSLASFQATSTTTVVSLYGVSVGGSNFIGIDDIRVAQIGAAAAPEPSALALMAGVLPALGLIGAAARSGRRRQRAA